MAVKRKRSASCKSTEKKAKTSEEKKIKDASPSPSPSPPPTPPEENEVRAIACLKMLNDMKRFELSHDCFILGFDPYEPVSLSQCDDLDVSVVAEKGQVACRDYPHSRHQCSKFPFKTTSHEKHCGLCYCYVCDVAAPCKYWTNEDHCHAENTTVWKDVRQGMRQSKSKSERS